MNEGGRVVIHWKCLPYAASGLRPAKYVRGCFWAGRIGITICSRLSFSIGETLMLAPVMLGSLNMPCHVTRTPCQFLLFHYVS